MGAEVEGKRSTSGERYLLRIEVKTIFATISGNFTPWGDLERARGTDDAHPQPLLGLVRSPEGPEHAALNSEMDIRERGLGRRLLPARVQSG